MPLMTILAGLLPIFLLIALGYVLKKSAFLPLPAWRPVETFAVYVLYPGFLVPAIWHADLSGPSAGPVGLAVLITIAIAALLGLALKPVLKLSGPTYSSVFQGLIRFNSFVFIPVAAALFGPKALGIAAVAVSALIPTTNLLSILVLAHWGEPEGEAVRRTPAQLARTVVTNPIFAACLLGLALNFLHVPGLPPIEKALTMLGEAAIPTGLILAGAGLSFGYVAARPLLVGAIAVFKVLIMPVICWYICFRLGGDRLAQGVALCCGAAPTAAAGYVLARHMGGDAPLMAGVIALTTVMSAVAVPVLLYAFHLS
ncbi:AEC family transporter [Asticcacaulis sp. EMRT-3]|uniref:AEC family transporter n=1 Tax=Asticcacaulis sp. EMRT-3 TaxID=3040349 RepID=UPI0024AF3E28|nr:AEC family transporter [Asticcacaulis sp. EMRT-3]MDI7774133.1 AEC family transporter [Asticcacaulis sp. EMRT-3]